MAYDVADANRGANCKRTARGENGEEGGGEARKGGKTSTNITGPRITIARSKVRKVAKDGKPVAEKVEESSEKEGAEARVRKKREQRESNLSGMRKGSIV